MTEKKLPQIHTMAELADFIALFWIGMIQNGRFEMPFKGDSEMTDLANMLRFTQTIKEMNIFSLDQIELVIKRTKTIVEREFMKGNGNLYTYTVYSNPKGYLGEMFKGISIPHGRFPFELYTCFFHSKWNYESDLRTNYLDRCRGEEGLVEILKEIPHGGVFCTRESGGYWKVVASIQTYCSLD